MPLLEVSIVLPFFDFEVVFVAFASDLLEVATSLRCQAREVRGYMIDSPRVRHALLARGDLGRSGGLRPSGLE